jgi:hypothetical protein
MLTVSSVLAMYLVRFAWRLEHFARHPLVGMNPNRINDPSNALSLRADLRREFGDFKLSFQATVCILANPEFVLSSYYY